MTELPEADLSPKDMWVVPGHVFALVSSGLRPSAVLEWSDAEGKWTSIDDGSQNFTRGGPTSIWAPNENEVYFAMYYWNTRSGVIYHGTRPSPPAAPEAKWTWTSTPLPCSATERPRGWPDRISLWGTSKDDVYALSCKRIYHLSSGGGERSWNVDYADDDVANPLDFIGAAGTGADDAWFVGARGFYQGNSCLVVLRKTPTGYARAIDGERGPEKECISRPGALLVKGSFPAAWGGASPVHAPAKGQLVGVIPQNDILKISVAPDGRYEVASTRPAAPLSDVVLRDVWGASENDLWILATRGDSISTFVLHGTNLWSDDRKYEFSTLARNGVPNFASLDRIRGTSVSNLWAVGAGLAYHKTSH